MSWTAPDSVQRVARGDVDPEDAIDAYFDWLSQRVPGVKVRTRDDVRHLLLWGSKRPAISLARAGGAAFRVCGGFLVAPEPGGSFSFRNDGAELLMELRGFTPRLPRFIYSITHSVLHALVMWAFCHFLARHQFEEPGS